MIKTKKILFITQEIEPYVPKSEYTVIGRDLPQYIQDEGREIRTFMPKWGNINERRNQLHEVIRLSGMNIIIDETDNPLIIKVASIPAARMQVYFIDSDEYFHKRLHVSDENGVEYDDNGLRSIFYARGVLETVKKLRWVPEIVHCQGWIAAAVPALIKTAYAEEPSFRDSRVIYSICEKELTKPLPERFPQSMCYRDCTEAVMEGLGMDADNLQKLAIKYADGVTVSTASNCQDLVEYARSLNKPVLKYPGNNLDTYLPFFDEIWSEGKPDEIEEDD